MSDLQQQIDELRKELSKFEKLHADFQHWNNSRRGVEGERGQQGIPGVGVPGPAGAPGKDANVSEVVQTAKQEMQTDLNKFQASLAGAIIQELKRSGVVDANGKAVLIPGPAGRDSVIPGPKGDSVKGESGRDGRDGVDGKTPNVSEVVSVAKSEVDSLVEAKLSEFQNGLRNLILKLLKERNVLDAQGNAVPGPAGKDSVVPGPSGRDGVDGKDAFVTVADISHLEARFRNIWKSDVQAGIRAHFHESHNN